MEFHIAHLYYDILNLYGEYANVSALKRQLETQGVEPIIHFLTIDDEMKFEDYDMIYIGAGTEENQKIVLKDLMRYQKMIQKRKKEGMFIFATGNAINFFGSHYIEKDETEVPCLNLLPYKVKEINLRMIDECFFRCDFLNEPVIGFQNQSTVMDMEEHTVFDVVRGVGMYPNSKREGWKDGTFFGTYLIGPVLTRNPELLTYMVKEMIGAKYPDIVFQPFDLELEQIAHDRYIERYFANLK